jgi:hypothetical protein
MLAETIRQHALADAEAGNWAAVAGTLNSLREPVLDETHWSFGLMMSRASLPAELVTGVAGAIQSAGQVDPLMASAFIAMSTTGLQLHTADRQAMIEQIGAGLPSEAVAAVKALGVRSDAVISTTAAECEAAWAADQLQIQRQALRSRIDAAWNQIGTSEQAEAIAEFRAIADELEAG